MYSLILDEDNGEMFVNDIFSKKNVVYDLYGNFKRSFKHKEDPKLKDGKLKDIAEKLDEDDNPVIMLVKHKKQ